MFLCTFGYFKVDFGSLSTFEALLLNFFLLRALLGTFAQLWVLLGNLRFFHVFLYFWIITSGYFWLLFDFLLLLCTFGTSGCFGVLFGFFWLLFDTFGPFHHFYKHFCSLSSFG